MNKDLEFLKEMRELTQSLIKGKYDITKVQQLDKMIEDWTDELNISVVNNRFIVRDWLVSEVIEFDNYNDAKKRYNEIYKETKNGDCDIQLYQILQEFNNVD